jgi:release factor glutamine methyltransferase
VDRKLSAIYKETVRTLSTIYELGESDALANRFFEDALGISKIHRLTSSEIELTESQFEKHKALFPRLLNGEPLQHILGFTFFFGYKFLVTPETLIPRQETEELVDLIVRTHSQISDLTILDIGTGTGCIAISLALELKKAMVIGWDISSEAVELAKLNAENLHANARFEIHDILKEEPAEFCDIIVSNPPYIPNKERVNMDKNVLDFDPSLALFVPDENPLIFFDRISSIASTKLNDSGSLYFEIHEEFGEEVCELLRAKRFHKVSLHRDLNGKDRMVSATKPPQ